jgi:hypothetical protein
MVTEPVSEAAQPNTETLNSALPSTVERQDSSVMQVWTEQDLATDPRLIGVEADYEELS